MPLSLRSVVSYLRAADLFAQAPVFSTPHDTAVVSSSVPSLASNCPLDGPLSCHNSTAGDSCCFIYPGGHLLLTQFWDTSPSIGPVDSWTLHGLWPDLCDGTYDQYCNAAPQYHNITNILQDAEQTDLLDYMSEYWLPNSGTAEHFYEHEWNKHGTCVNTMSAACYGDDYAAGQEVVDFFNRAVSLFKTLDTYSALEAAGIVPTKSQTYTLAELQDALLSVTGSPVVLSCRRGELNQAWYSYNVRGSLQTGEFVPAAPVGATGNCPQSGIRYLPKRG